METKDLLDDAEPIDSTPEAYSTRLHESTSRLNRYTAESDLLLDEVASLRLQIREMKSDRRELIRAHHESMSLLAAVSEEKLTEVQSKSEVEAEASKAAQEEALRTVLEMMERDCEERVQELDAKLAEAEEERERAAQMQAEAARLAEEERENRSDVEEACRLAVEKLVKERESRSAEMEERSVREMELQRELEEMQRVVADENRAREERGDRGQDYMDEESYDESYDTPRTGSAVRRSADMPQSGEYVSKRPPVIDNSKEKRASLFIDDPPSSMTRGRRIALSLQNSSWYRPHHKKHWDASGLGLQSAWCYFEHSVLPRYMVKNLDGTLPPPIDRSNIMEDDEEDGRVSVYEQSVNGSTVNGSTVNGEDERSNFINDESDVDDWLDKPKDKKKKKPVSSSRNDWRKQPKYDQNNFPPQRKIKELTKASPGESTYPTRLYSAFFTPLSQMGAFGIGIGLYFSTLLGVSFITLVAGLINLPNMMYFAGDEYSSNQVGVHWALRGSAVCTETVWVPCPSCEMDDFRRSPEKIAGTTTVNPDGELQTLTFALKNTCDGATMDVGIYNLASLGWVFLAFLALTIYQRRKQRQLDEKALTPQDYSIEIWNPPEDATEPEEWRDFFESRFGAHVTCCTVTIDNDLLVKTLAERREVISMLEEKVREGSMLNTMKLSEISAKIEHGRRFLGNLKSRINPGVPELTGRLTVLNAKVQGLTQQDYIATRVFCTFEMESMQRRILSEMMVGSMTAYRNNTHKINPKLLFRGERVLLVREAEEPNTIRWTDLDEQSGTRIRQLSITTFIGLVCVGVVASLIYVCHQFSKSGSALVISVANTLYPIVAKMLTNLETHPSETGRHISLYVKIAIFRWVVTAIIITLIVPFTYTLGERSDDLLGSIFAIFWYDLLLSNAVQLLDPIGNIQRHFLAPRATSQDRMNLLMGGTEYFIAERYTNMTKTLFLTFYYCSIYPSAFLVCAITLFVNFNVDRFSLMRTWKPSPAVNASIADFSRTYFMSSAFAAMALVSSYFFAGFPYDNLCAEDVSHSAYYGTWQIVDGNGKTSSAIVTPGERSFEYCNQFLGPGPNFSFPVGPEKQPPDATWMTAEQEQLTGIYGIVSIAALSLVGALLLYSFLKAVKGLFSASFEACGKDQGVPFSENEHMTSYIPQALSDHFTHPLLAVNIDELGVNLFDWTDPDRSHSYYDLTRDAEQLLGGNEDLCYRAFSRVRHWPPHPSSGEKEGGKPTTRSALRRHKDMGHKRNISWSSKVTCKTYSKDDANHWDSFDANASSTKMNFDRHDPIHDPGAEDEARTFKESSSDGTQSADGYEQQPDQNGDHYYHQQNDPRGPRNQQQTPAQHFDPYYNTGLDYANQLPDQMYGDSQQQDNDHQYEGSYDDAEQYYDTEQYDDADQQDHGASWDGSREGSYDQSSATGSSAYSQSDGSYGSYDQRQDPNAQMQSQSDGGSFASVESSHQSQQSEGRSFASVESSQQSEFSGDQRPSAGVDSDYNDSGEDFNDSGQSYDDQGYGDYEEDDQQYQDGEEYGSREEGSYDEYSDDGEEEDLLPPMS